MTEHSVYVGDVVMMKGFKRVHRNELTEATFSYQQRKGYYAAFVFIGDVASDVASLDAFDPDAVIRSMGYVLASEVQTPAPDEHSLTAEKR